MRLLFFIRSLNVGGTERQLAMLAPQLAARGHDVHVVLLYGGGAMTRDVAAQGVVIHDLGKSGRWDLAVSTTRLVRLVRRVAPDIIYSLLTTQTMLMGLLKPLLGPVRLVAGVRTSDNDMAHYDPVARLCARVEPILSRADLIICNARAGRAAALGMGFPDDRTIVVPNGFDVDALVRNEAVGAKVRAEWGFDAASPVVGIVARLDPIKDHAGFLRAAALAATKNPALRFAVIGEGTPDYETALRQQAAHSGLQDKVAFIGLRRDIAAVYSALDIGTLCSSSGEGFPNVIGEGMACGVPQVATDVGDARWIIGDTGIVVPRADAEALAQGWLTLTVRLAAEGDHLRALARARITQSFSRDRLVQRTEAALADLAGC